MSTTPSEVSVSDTIDALINFNSSMLDRFVSLMEKIENDLITAGSGQLQGEVEELLRSILQTADKAIETLLSFQENLQTRFIESYFPAQD
ncbi:MULTISPECIES: hypothetical protein [Microbulbifer]|uniref:Sugar-specific transcriptional regulator TrmB n=1 Tax=Microbulbifer rhizosphaerae TaxID=1562603 RepID=A0A7W4W9G6_9GAMM|nr:MULTISPECIES: hypothetical protein [Microbulbifer]MBB3060135.1 sugar-specific transcriptional regulator TrmB [Microbulbifer rhizosphaerae]